MADRREAILARLVEVGASLTGIKTSIRNVDTLSDTARPGIVVLDADENADTDIKHRGRPPLSPNLHALMPEVQILVGGPAQTVGTTLNAFRALFLKALRDDALSGALAGLIGSTGNVFYDGCTTDFGRERQMSATMTLSLEIRYPFNIGEL
jgi:hypothetical protein